MEICLDEKQVLKLICIKFLSQSQKYYLKSVHCKFVRLFLELTYYTWFVLLFVLQTLVFLTSWIWLNHPVLALNPHEQWKLYKNLKRCAFTFKMSSNCCFSNLHWRSVSFNFWQQMLTAQFSNLEQVLQKSVLRNQPSLLTCFPKNFPTPKINFDADLNTSRTRECFEMNSSDFLSMIS